MTPDHVFSTSLASLPTPAKVLLTAFLALIGVGYLSALGNLYHQHRFADERPGLSMDDLRATFHGIDASEAAQGAGAAQRVDCVVKSRMFEMVEPGGEMRKHAEKGGPQAVRALEHWLCRGALEPEFAKASLVAEGDPSAESTIARHCLRCHNAEEGEKSDTPYGADIFTADFKLVFKFAAPGTALVAARPADGGPRRLGPTPLPHLFLITHIHMLSIPVFTLIVSGTFLLTHYPARFKAWLAVIPMLTLCADFSSWWLARISESFVYVIAGAGAVFAASLAIQIIAVALSIWRRRPSGP